MEVSTQAACSAHAEFNGGSALRLHVVLMRNSMEVSTQAACSAHEELNGGQHSGCM